VRGKGLVEIPAIKSSLCGLSHIAAESDPVKHTGYDSDFSLRP
jgi:hypothetical protein